MPDLDRDGYAFADLVLAEEQCERIAEELPSLEQHGRGGVRDLLAHPSVTRLIEDARLRQLVTSIGGRELVAIQATLFDKTAGANWRVQWHQDRVMKTAATRVEPSAEVLAEMLALRMHLDASEEANGPLRVIPRSHRHGKLDDASLMRVVSEGPVVELYAPRGAMLWMRPLLVHASSPARAPRHRRVLHIAFAPAGALSRPAAASYLRDVSALMGNGYPEDCVAHACRIAGLLLDEGKAPWIAAIRDVEGAMHHPLVPQRFLGSGAAPTWNVHYVCCADDRAYDPLVGEPMVIDGFTLRVFGREISMREAVSADAVAELRTFEALKARMRTLRFSG